MEVRELELESLLKMAEEMVPLKDRLNRVLSSNEAKREMLRKQADAFAGDKNKRQAPRKPSSMPAYLQVAGRHRMIHCKIMDMSATGACIKVLRADKHIKEDVSGFPDFLTLYITYDKVSIDCQIAWRLAEKNQIGVRFMSPAKSYQ